MTESQTSTTTTTPFRPVTDGTHNGDMLALYFKPSRPDLTDEEMQEEYDLERIKIRMLMQPIHGCTACYTEHSTGQCGSSTNSK